MNFHVIIVNSVLKSQLASSGSYLCLCTADGELKNTTSKPKRRRNDVNFVLCFNGFYEDASKIIITIIVVVVCEYRRLLKMSEMHWPRSRYQTHSVALSVYLSHRYTKRENNNHRHITSNIPILGRSKW